MVAGGERAGIDEQEAVFLLLQRHVDVAEDGERRPGPPRPLADTSQQHRPRIGLAQA